MDSYIVMDNRMPINAYNNVSGWPNGVSMKATAGAHCRWCLRRSSISELAPRLRWTSHPTGVEGWPWEQAVPFLSSTNPLPRSKVLRILQLRKLRFAHGGGRDVCGLDIKGEIQHMWWLFPSHILSIISLMDGAIGSDSSATLYTLPAGASCWGGGARFMIDRPVKFKNQQASPKGFPPNI